MVYTVVRLSLLVQPSSLCRSSVKQESTCVMHVFVLFDHVKLHRSGDGDISG